ncbi:hypothetical protein BSKO_10041 [Bryopsis sp. KO-2023]|nr:hypothetical protein BSKO_10041 [Bryopsis sp. KO-2023]
MCCGENSARGKLWTVWFPVNVIGLVYCALNLATFSEVWRAYKKLENNKSENLTIVVATAICTFLVLVFGVWSFLLLLFKTMGRSRAGFTYGFLTSSAANLSLLLLLSSLMMTGYKSDVEGFEGETELDWDPKHTKMFIATFSFGYIAALGYMIFFGAMFCLSSAIDDPAAPDVQETLVDQA